LLAHQHWLQDTVLTYGLRELAELLLVEKCPRLPRIGPNLFHGYFAQTHRGVRNQRAETATQPAFVGAAHLSSPRRINSWARSA
jgi:hypothetical protein